MRRLVMALVVMVGVSAPGGAQTTDTATPPTATAFTLRTSVKTGALLFGARGPEDARVSNAGDELLGRVRVDSRLQLGTHVDLTAAYEHRVRRLSTSRAASAVSVLPAEAPPPYRLAALDWQVARSDTAAWHHEIDRAAAHIRGGAADITIGRQAIGWGRGVVFGAVDLFAPFSPLEIDREWRRGIDAVHADVRLSDRASTDGVVALGRRWSDALTAVRVRGYRGDIDVEAMAGKRAEDWFTGVTTSAAIAGAEVHGEVAVFRLPTPLPFDHARTVSKVVVGSSYRLPLGSGVLAYAEYHYSGFGVRHPGDVPAALAQPAYAARVLRGDTQILSRHAIALVTSYELSPLVSLSGSWIGSPGDRSGIVVPNLTLTPGDRVSIIAAVYLPYGATLRDGRLGSVYGASPLSAFGQLRLYF